MSETENPFESRPRIFVVDVEVEIAKMELKAYKKIANIDDLVEKSGSANDAKRSKPHPDIFEATLKKLGLSHQQVLALATPLMMRRLQVKLEFGRSELLPEGGTRRSYWRQDASKSTRMLLTSWNTLNGAHF